MDLMVIMGIVLVLMETIMVSGMMDSIGGMLNPIGKMPKYPKHTTKRNFVMVLLEKANGS